MKLNVYRACVYCNNNVWPWYDRANHIKERGCQGYCNIVKEGLKEDIYINLELPNINVEKTSHNSSLIKGKYLNLFTGELN